MLGSGKDSPPRPEMSSEEETAVDSTPTTSTSSTSNGNVNSLKFNTSTGITVSAGLAAKDKRAANKSLLGQHGPALKKMRCSESSKPSSSSDIIGIVPSLPHLVLTHDSINGSLPSTITIGQLLLYLKEKCHLSNVHTLTLTLGQCDSEISKFLKLFNKDVIGPFW